MDGVEICYRYSGSLEVNFDDFDVPLTFRAMGQNVKFSQYYQIPPEQTTFPLIPVVIFFSARKYCPADGLNLNAL